MHTLIKATPPTDDTLAPLRSVHTHTFVQLLQQIGASLVVSTYQAGKLIVARADGETLNTHFRVFNQPMGLAADSEKIALGTAHHIWELRNVPAAGQTLEPLGKHDGCYIPRRIHITGDIDIHEMAWVGEDLWFVNTRFSCLCTLDDRYSFVPRWRPPFVSSYEMSDRCHLNGLGVRDGKPRYVTALGETDSPNGWRANKANGGLLMDIESNEILYRDLSMPHSPRWYRDKLWVLESGKGTLAWLDLETRQLNAVTQLPGFTRGLDFYGDFAFVGLSQVRESAVFSGIPLTQTLTERICGIWVVNIVSGETVAFLHFQDAVQEIFAVSVLPGQRFPEVIDTDGQLMGGSYVLPDEALAEVVHPNPDQEFAQPYFEQGVQQYQAGQLEAAIATFKTCLDLRPDHLPARYNLGVTLGDLSRFDEAITELEQVIQAEASHAEAHNSLGYVYSQQQRLEQAITHFKWAIQIQPDFIKAHQNLDATLLQLGEPERDKAKLA
ncbi:MAG: TIGR03032 family protein [Cyanobacteria bacterium J06635_1]